MDGADLVRRAWTIRQGTRTQRTAGKIHRDSERGFIRTELAAYNDLIVAGNFVTAKVKGLLYLEDKDYISLMKCSSSGLPVAPVREDLHIVGKQCYNILV